MKESGEFHRADAIRPVRIFPEQLAGRAHELVFTFRTSMIRDVEKAGCLKDARVVWSMWPSYLTRPGQERFLRCLESHQMPIVTHHASGHAYVADLQRFVRAVSPGRVVPIHSFAPERFGEFFENIELYPGGEWWPA